MDGIFRIGKTKDAFIRRMYDLESQDTIRLYMTGSMVEEPGLVTGDHAAVGARYYKEATRGEFDGKHIRVQHNRGQGYHGVFAFNKPESLAYDIASTRNREEIEKTIFPLVVKRLHDLIEERVFIRNHVNGGFSLTPAKITIYWGLHTKNRHGEPHLHLHWDSPNMGLNSEGNLRCTDWYNVFKDQKELGQKAGELYRHFRSDIQKVIYDKDGNVFGITEEQKRAFSTRSRDVAVAKEHLYSDKAKSSDLPAAMTRINKEDLPSTEHLEERNRRTAANVGLSAEGLEAAQKAARKWLQRLDKNQTALSITWDEAKKLNTWFTLERAVNHVCPNRFVRDDVRTHVYDGVNPNLARTINSYKASWGWKPTLTMVKGLFDRYDFSANRKPIKTFLKSLETAVRPKDVFGRGNFVIVHDADKLSHEDLALTLEKAKHCTVFFMGDREKTLALAREREKEKEFSR